jgi:hypothetical protein
MAATQINGITTSNIRIDIQVDDRPNIGVKSGTEVASILRQLADHFEAGHRPNLPVLIGKWEYPHVVNGANIDYH